MLYFDLSACSSLTSCDFPNFKALQKSQLDVQTLKKRCTELRLANATLTAKLASKQPGKGRKKKDTDTSIEEHQERILKDGSRWEVYKRYFTPEGLAVELGGGETLFAGRWFVAVRS